MGEGGVGEGGVEGGEEEGEGGADVNEEEGEEEVCRGF